MQLSKIFLISFRFVNLYSKRTLTFNIQCISESCIEMKVKLINLIFSLRPGLGQEGLTVM